MIHSHTQTTFPAPKLDTHRELLNGYKKDEAAAAVDPAYACIFEAGTANTYRSLENDFFGAFTTTWNSYKNTKVRLVSIETGPIYPDAKTSPGQWYLGNYQDLKTAAGSSPNLLATPSWSDFMQNFNQTNGSNSRLLDFSIQRATGDIYYFGSWGGDPVKQIMLSNYNYQNFLSEFQFYQQGYILSKIQIIPTATELHITGLAQEGSASSTLYRASSMTDFINHYNSIKASMKLVDFQVGDDYSTPNPVRYYFGVFQATADTHDWVQGLAYADIQSAVNTRAPTLALTKLSRYQLTMPLPNPQWRQYFKNALSNSVMGFSFCVMKQGQIVDAWGYGNARSSADGQTAFTADTYFNLASVSKGITAVALMHLLQDKGISWETPFYELPGVRQQFPNVGANVDKVRLRDLLTMKSGMVANDKLGPNQDDPPNWSIWTFLTDYLAAPINAADIGVKDAYSNANFTIIQAVVDCVTGHGGQGTKDSTNPDFFYSYVRDNVLVPMGITGAEMGIVPTAEASAPLTYSSSSDTGSGLYWDYIPLYGCGGWLATAKGLGKFLSGVRNNAVMKPAYTQIMLDQGFGWYQQNGIFGPYFHHNGGLVTGTQGLGTGIVRLGCGYDACVFGNSWNNGAMAGQAVSLPWQALEAV